MMPNKQASEKIAREWYSGRGMKYAGVDIGKCIEYDVLQIVNRILLEQKAKMEKTNDTEIGTAAKVAE